MKKIILINYLINRFIFYFFLYYNIIMTTNNNNISMQTPIQNIPLNNKNSSDISDDTNDPQVQDILKEFEEEIIATKKPIIPQQQQQQQQQYIPQQQQYIPQQQNKKNIKNYTDYIDNNIIKKCIIIVIILIIIFNTSIFSYILSHIPNKISNIITNYELYVKNIIIFLTLYILYFYKVL